jgi:hypothetical protein
MKQGHGVMIDTDKSTYDGGWDNNKKHGHGIVTWPDGDCYVGNWDHGKKQGKGKYTWEDGTQYDGHFVNDQFQDLGTYTWPDGRVYMGEWKEGKKEGHGRMTWPDGNSYVGAWKHDQQNGYGVMSIQTKSLEGTWVNNKIMDGFITSNGKRIELVQGKIVDEPPAPISLSEVYKSDQFGRFEKRLFTLAPSVVASTEKKDLMTILHDYKILIQKELLDNDVLEGVRKVDDSLYGLMDKLPLSTNFREEKLRAQVVTLWNSIPGGYFGLRKTSRKPSRKHKK